MLRDALKSPEVGLLGLGRAVEPAPVPFAVVLAKRFLESMRDRTRGERGKFPWFEISSCGVRM